MLRYPGLYGTYEFLAQMRCYDPTQYSVEWANVITAYLKKQLADIGLPSAPRPGLNIKSTFKGVLSDPETRDRWISRFQYCLSLLRSFYSEGLVDNRTFLAWLVLQMRFCNLAQASFVARLSDEYLAGIVVCRALAHPFVEGCLVKMMEIRSTSARPHLPHLEDMLRIFLQVRKTSVPVTRELTLGIKKTCLVMPDSFVSPHMWIVHEGLIRDVIIAQSCPASAQGGQQEVVQQFRNQLKDNIAEVARRNDAMLFRNLPPRVLARLSEAVVDVMVDISPSIPSRCLFTNIVSYQHLNSISLNTDFDTFTFFDSQLTDAQFASKVDRLLTWSVTPLQYGDHRPYAAVTLLPPQTPPAKCPTNSPAVHIHQARTDFLDDSFAPPVPVKDVALPRARNMDLRTVAKKPSRLNLAVGGLFRAMGGRRN
ncbi:hypothetical protein EWM64_g7062 [Hericium alpestre]|uniref:Uncharacterized protein n=1 Tax=Hericium alpestre TaxID=135208 RepID=A0A4Y9ZTW7_9AGAM|nr:hypothetical protein EWM64_g7062 [Hericium alpestre]